MSGFDPERFERAFHRVSVDQIWEMRRAIVGPTNMPPGEQAELAKLALTALKAGNVPTPKQVAALELIVRLMRPSLLSTNREFSPLPPEAANLPDWDGFGAKVRPSLYTVGRVDDAAGKGLGTGFLVSPRLLVTNTHVLDQLSHGARVLERGQASVRFRREFGVAPDESPYSVVKVVAVHPTLDLSLFEVDPVPLDGDREVLPIDAAGAAKGQAVAVLGYPQNDSARNPMFVAAIFEGRFGVKRAAPGEVIDSGDAAFYHDCSTLGGSSGSPVVALDSGRVVGVHCSGDFLYRNDSVPGAGLSAFVHENL